MSDARPFPRSICRSASGARIAAAAPRLLGLVAVCLLAALGLRGLLTGLPVPGPAPIPIRPADDLAVRAFAEAFARAYLAWDPRHPGTRLRALAPLAARDLGEGAGLEPPADGAAQSVGWTAVVADRPAPRAGRVVTVAVHTSAGERYLDVPVTREGRGALVVAAAPALVGPPRTDPGHLLVDEDPVADPALLAVARRALANYLASDRTNLLADLAPGAAVVMPAPLRVTLVGEVTWAERSRGVVAVVVRALLPGGASAQLRYALSVVEQGRWLVRSIGGG